MPRVYDQNNNLLGILHLATSVGYRQVNNDLWTATFTLPADDSKNEYCKPFNYIEIFDEGRRIELFRIIGQNLTRNTRGFIVYECEQVVATLLDDVLFQFHQIGNIGVFTTAVINYILSFQTVRNWRLGRCDFRHQFLYKWESVNLLAALFSVPQPFGDEWHFTYDTTVYPWVINLVRAETELSCEVRYGKNMQGIERQIDATNLITRIMPLGHGEGDNQLTIESVNNGRNFLEADTVGIWGRKATIWTDRRFEDAANMMATAAAILDRLKNPWICYTVTSIDLFKRTKQDFDMFTEGRIVRVIDKLDGINVDTRIVEISKPDVTKADITVVIENQDRNIAGSIAALQERARINDTYAQGAETLLTIPFTDNAEASFPAIFEFYIPPNMVNINEAILRVQLLPFRAFSRAIQGGGGTTQSTTAGGGTTATSTSGGGTTQSTTAGGGTTRSTTAGGGTTRSTTAGGGTTATSTSGGGTTQSTTAGGGTTATSTSGGGGSTTSQSGGGGSVSSGSNNADHGSQGATQGPVPDMTGSPTALEPQHIHDAWHTHLVNVGTHTHTVNIPAHSHNFTIDAHSHRVTIESHSHSVTIPPHQHNVTIDPHSHSVTIDPHSHSVTIDPHSHSVTIPPHQHNVTIEPHSHQITLPDHTHQIEFGIFQGTRAQSISVRVDGNLMPIPPDLNEINIIPFLRRGGGGRIIRGAWHQLEIVPDRLTRISAHLFIRFFTNARGGGNF